MPTNLQSVGKFLARTAALKAGLSLLRPRNLKKPGLGLGATAAAGISFLAFRAISKK